MRSEATWSQAKKLASLHAELRPIVERLAGRMALHGFNPKIFFAYRGLETQARLKARGNSGVSVSFHNHTENGEPAALAVDLVDAELGWGNPVFFQVLGEEAEALGLIWGGRWTNPDEAHVQLWPNSRLGEVRA